MCQHEPDSRHYSADLQAHNCFLPVSLRLLPIYQKLESRSPQRSDRCGTPTVLTRIQRQQRHGRQCLEGFLHFVGVFQRGQDVARATEEKVAGGGQGDRGKTDDQQADF